MFKLKKKLNRKKRKLLYIRSKNRIRQKGMTLPFIITTIEGTITSDEFMKRGLLINCCMNK